MLSSDLNVPGSVRVKRIHWRTSWGACTPATKSKIEDGSMVRSIARRRERTVLPMVLPSRILDKLNGSSPSCASNFRHFATPRTPRGSLTGGHVKMMLAYGHTLSHDHQGFRPFSPDHREAAGPVGPAVARVQVYCKLQTVPPCALATASTAVM